MTVIYTYVAAAGIWFASVFNVDGDEMWSMPAVDLDMLKVKTEGRWPVAQRYIKHRCQTWGQRV
jgi:hypothetical protein